MKSGIDRSKKKKKLKLEKLQFDELAPEVQPPSPQPPTTSDVMPRIAQNYDDATDSPMPQIETLGGAFAPDDSRNEIMPQIETLGGVAPEKPPVKPFIHDGQPMSQGTPVSGSRFSAFGLQPEKLPVGEPLGNQLAKLDPAQFGFLAQKNAEFFDYAQEDDFSGVQPPTQPAQQNPVSSVMPQLSPSQETMRQINEIYGRDRSIKKDKDGRVFHRGKDRDEDYDWKDVLGGGALGFLKGLAMTGNLGGGIAGAIGGGLDRNFTENHMDELKLARLLPRLKVQQQAEQFNANQDSKAIQGLGQIERIRQGDERIAQADERITQSAERLNETKRKNAQTAYDQDFKRAIAQIRLGYARGENPEFDEKLAKLGIEIEKWDNNNRTFWQGQNLMTFDEKGNAVPVSDSSGNPVTDETRKPVTVELDGETFTVSQTEAFRGKSNAARTNTQIENDDIEDQNRYNRDVKEHEKKIGEYNSKISSLEAARDNLQLRNEQLKNESARLDLETYDGATRKKQIDEETEKNVKLWRDKNEEIIKLKGERDTLPQPAPLKKRKKTDSPTVKQSVSEEVFRQRLIANRIPQSQHAAIIAKAKKDGVIK